MDKIQKSVKIRKELDRRVLTAIAATGTEHSYSGVVELAVDQFLAGLYVNRFMLEGYDPAKDKSVTRKSKRKYSQEVCTTEKENR